MDVPSPAAESPPAWSLPHRLAFRFGIVFAGLLLFPFPLGVIPKTDWLQEAIARPFQWAAIWTATEVLGLDEPATAFTGSGDTTLAYVQHLLFVVLALVGAAAWSALDRKRLAYPRLQAAALVVLRYYLAFTLLTYAIAKLTQFPPPHWARLDQRVGEMSPMGILWTFMGSSQPYALFGGFAEALGGLLLLWRRTTLAGALVAAATMTNVVALNYCYDVPVKLFSTQLLLLAGLIALPHARRLVRAVLGYPAAEVPPRPRGSRRWERGRRIAKTLWILTMFAQLVFSAYEWSGYRPPAHELDGTWSVERYVLEGTERPPLATDADRWHKLSLMPWGGAVRLMTEERVRFAATLDAAARTIAIENEAKDVWRYTRGERGDRATLVLDGTFRGKQVHVELVRDPPPLLVTRGFHWINEVPYNR